MARQWRIEYEEALYHVLSRTISSLRPTDRICQDLLLYLLWETGLYKGSEIGEVFGLRYSSVSRRGHMVRARLERDSLPRTAMSKADPIFFITFTRSRPS